MGGHCLWSRPSSSPAIECKQILDSLKGLGGVDLGEWRVSVEQLQSRGSSRSAVSLVRCWSRPSELYVVSANRVMECGNAGKALMGVLRKFQSRGSVSWEGRRVGFGDFVVAVGKSAGGIVLDLEYLPCSKREQCEEILKEFMEEFIRAADSQSKLLVAQSSARRDTQESDAAHLALEYATLVGGTST